MTDTRKLRETPETDAEEFDGYDEHRSCLGSVVYSEVARTLERQRDELAEALRYWMPDREVIPSWPLTIEGAITWNKHAALLAKIEGERK